MKRRRSRGRTRGRRDGPPTVRGAYVCVALKGVRPFVCGVETLRGAGVGAGAVLDGAAALAALFERVEAANLPEVTVDVGSLRAKWGVKQ